MWEQVWRRVDQVNLIKRLPLIGVICCCVTLAIGASTLWNGYVRTEADAQETISDLGAALADQAAHHIQAADILLRDLQSRVRRLGITTPEALISAFTGPNGRGFMTLLVEELHGADGIGLFSRDGTLIISGRRSDAFSIADRAYFLWLRDHRGDALVFGGPWRSRANGQMAFYVARRIENADGTFLGVVSVGLTTQYFTDLYGSIVNGRRIDITLLHTDGTLLARYPPLPVRDGAPPIKVRPESRFFDHVAGGGGSFRAPGYLTGRSMFVSVRLVPGYPLVINVAEDAAAVLHAWWVQSVFALAATPALATALLVLFLGIARGVRSQERHAAALAEYTAALRASEERLDRAQEIAAMGSWELNMETGHNIWSRNLFRIRGVDPGTDVSEPGLVNVLPPDEMAMRLTWLAELGAGRQPGALDMEARRPDGTVRILQVEGRAIVDADGRIRRLTGTTRDVTQLRLLERELIQSQKMEAIGTLAGGIAHDFNNLLGIIIGNLDLLRPLVENTGEAAELCDEALEGATRGADLVKRLLAFARRQPLRPEPVEVNAMVTDVARLLRRALGDGVLLRTELGRDAGSAMVDPAQLQASLVNLGTNARDAMPAGGQLHIGTHGITIGAAETEQHDGVAPGTYAVITVRDTGTGMDPGVVKRIFEPFFTTKGQDKGSGLGLSMVLGFVRQSGGHLSVRSEPGIGSSFRLYLPRIADFGHAARPPDAAPAPASPGGDVVLLVDTNAAFRRASVRQLSGLGYRVHEAADAAAAMRVLEQGERIDFLLTDLVLCGPQDGLDLAEAATELRPALHVVLMSCRTGIRDAKARLARWGQPVLGKPFFADEVAAALRGATLRQMVL